MERDRQKLEKVLSEFEPILNFVKKYPNTSINIVSSPKFHVWLHVDEGELTQDQMNRIKIIKSHAIPHERRS